MTAEAEISRGLKRICTNCGTRFYDMTRRPIVCPQCNTSFTGEVKVKTRRVRGVADETAGQVAQASGLSHSTESEEEDEDEGVAEADVVPLEELKEEEDDADSEDDLGIDPDLDMDLDDDQDDPDDLEGDISMAIDEDER